MMKNMNDVKTKWTKAKLNKYIRNDLLLYCRNNKLNVTTQQKKSDMIKLILDAQKKNELLHQVDMTDTKAKMGQPRKIDVDELMTYFMEYYEDEGFKITHKYDLEGIVISTNKQILQLTIEGFMFYLVGKGVISGMRYWYDLGKDYSNIKKEIQDIMKMHTQKGIAIGDINTAWGIFYAKNMFGMSDRTEVINRNLNTDIEKNEYSDEELERLIQIASGGNNE